MEFYTNAELELVNLAAGDINSVSNIDTGENGLPLDSTGATNASGASLTTG